MDMFVMEMFNLFNEIWAAKGCKFGDHFVQIETYKCLPSGAVSGFVEFVQWSKTLREFEQDGDGEDIDRYA